MILFCFDMVKGFLFLVDLGFAFAAFFAIKIRVLGSKIQI